MTLSFHSSVNDSLPLGGFALTTSANVLRPLKAPSATPCTMTQKTKLIPRMGYSLNQFLGLIFSKLVSQICLYCREGRELTKLYHPDDAILSKILDRLLPNVSENWFQGFI